ncbi:hypothetical protein Bca4012_037197 [Brassica carinata]
MAVSKDSTYSRLEGIAACKVILEDGDKEIRCTFATESISSFDADYNEVRRISSKRCGRNLPQSATRLSCLILVVVVMVGIRVVAAGIFVDSFAA